MPLSNPFANRRIVEVVEGIRQHPDAAYGIAIGLVALATLTRWAMGDYIGGNVPFITFFPAIIIGALLGGIWPGVCATILSVLAAWYLFLPPAFSFELEYREFVQLLLFVFFCLINLAAVAVVNAVMDRARAQEENARILLDGVPAGIVVLDAQGNIKLVNASTERLFGYKQFELLNRNVEVLVPDGLADVQQVERNTFLQKPAAQAIGVRRDLRARRRDGTEFPVEIGLSPVSHNGGSAVLATITDLSERKRPLSTGRIRPLRQACGLSSSPGGRSSDAVLRSRAL
jgi:PAS domain S-box-containing protein